jgi:primosomal protein N' (replication factor Y)
MKKSNENQKKCMSLLKKYKLPEKIINHILGVTKVAIFLAKKFKKKGINIDIDLIEKASLLHDLDKIIYKLTNKKHGELSAKILTKEGFSKKIIEIVKKHTITSLFKKETTPQTWEEKIVYYADKIFDQSICSVDERLDKMIQENPQYIKESKILKPLIIKLEKEILDKINITFESIKTQFLNNEQQLIASIIPAIRLPRQLNYFDYLIPKKLENKIKINQIVEILFHNQKIKGIVIEITNKTQNKYNFIKSREAEISSKTKLFNRTKLKEINKIIEPKIILPEHLIKLAKWIKKYYYSSLPLIIKIILPEIPKHEMQKHFHGLTYETAKNLTISRESVPRIKKIIHELIYEQKNTQTLLYYKNWKEKLTIYIKIIKQLTNKNSTKQILIIVPQITDIQEIYKYLNYYFPNQIAILHNKLSKILFWQEWQKIYNQKIKIILGTRLAIFAPIKNLNLIIVDNEEVLTEYKSEQNPRYNVQELAKKLSELTKTKLIFSSQTPHMETYFLSSQSLKLRIKSLYNTTEANEANIKIINMQDEWRKNNYSLISDNLEEIIKQNLKKKQKIFLFLNRRGAGTTIKCQDCGYLFKCPNCNLPFNSSYKPQTTSYKLICYHCNFALLNNSVFDEISASRNLTGFTQNIPTKCPQCNGVNIKTSGIGIQRVEKEIKKLFPTAKVIRIDKDAENINYKLRILNHESQITNYDIVIGTQFFFKLFNSLANKLIFNLIGIISADSLLYRPDFRSFEKTFQQLSKIINWANNQSITNKQIKILIQTHSPENYVIQALSKQDYDFFYEREIKMREKFNYPPFCKLIKLIYQNSDLKKVEEKTNELASRLKLIKDLIFYQMLPIIPKVREKYRKQIILKIINNQQSTINNELEQILKNLDENWIIDVDPIEIL